MKHILLISLIFLSYFLKGQHFTGEIIYKTLIISNVDNKVTLKPEKSTYLISDNQYKSTILDNYLNEVSYTYNNEDNLIYDNHYNKKYITYRSSEENMFTYQEPVINKDSIHYVLGHPCFVLKQVSSEFNTTIYYSMQDHINYEEFAGHNYSNWYQRQKLVKGALPLKIIFKGRESSTIYEAVELKRRKVNKEEFKLDNKPLIASNKILDVPVVLPPFNVEQIICYSTKMSQFINLGQKIESEVAFVLTKDGEIKYVNAITKDSYGFHKIAINIIKNCNFKIEPGRLNGEKVDCEIIVPITLN